MINLLNPELFLALALAMLHWTARWRGWMRIGTATKPLVMIALILWSLSEGGWGYSMRWFAAGLMLSLVGDVLLMLPRRFFTPGLSCFLLAHLCYTAGFCQPAPALHPILIALAVLLMVGSYFYFHNLVIALQAKAYGKRFIIPVIIYGVILCGMTLSACQTLLRPDWPASAAAFAAVGGIFFLLSDCLLAYNRFVSPLPGGKTFEMVSYHLAQAAIIAGALLH